MAVSASRVRSRWSAGHLPDTPGFRRRHRVLASMLALHLPALGALAVLTGGAVHDVLVEAAIVVLALAVGAFLDTSPRLRSLALTAGLLWCSVVVGLLTATVVWAVLHAATVGLLAAAHVGASWRSPRSSLAAEPERGAERDGAGPAPPVADGHDGGRGDENADGLVEVQEVYTGVWSAQHLVRPRTRLIHLPERPPEQSPTITPTAHEEHATTIVPDPAPEAGADPVDQHGASASDIAAAEPAASRDPDLTREVLEALHLGSVEEVPTSDALERVTTGPPTS